MSMDSIDRPTVTAGGDHYLNTWCLYVCLFQNLAKQILSENSDRYWSCRVDHRRKTCLVILFQNTSDGFKLHFDTETAAQDFVSKFKDCPFNRKWLRPFVRLRVETDDTVDLNQQDSVRVYESIALLIYSADPRSLFHASVCTSVLHF